MLNPLACTVTFSDVVTVCYAWMRLIEERAPASLLSPPNCAGRSGIVLLDLLNEARFVVTD